jgi:DNA-directed RNA polymerase specialized sigma24 family protein
MAEKNTISDSNSTQGSSEERPLEDWLEVPEQEQNQPKTPSTTATCWTMIGDAINEKSPTTKGSREQLTKRYWPAIFAFIKASGRSVTVSEDLTQGFICDVFLGRNLLSKAEESRGRFRSLLLSSVRNYIADDYRKQTAKRRAPSSGPPGSLDAHSGMETADKTNVTPESAFNIRWIDELILRTSEETKSALIANGQGAHWDIFKLRVLDPCLLGATPIPHEELSAKWGLDGLPQVSNFLVTAKRRFARTLLLNVRETLPENQDPSLELRELFKALGN